MKVSCFVPALPSVTCTLATVAVGGRSSSVIVSVLAVVVPRVALVGDDSVTNTVSSGSSTASATTATSIDLSC